MNKQLKQFISLFIILLILPISAIAGDVNVDGSGGGGTGSGTGANNWINGEDGVRITVVEESSNTAKTQPMDFANKIHTDIDIHFNYRDKITYRYGTNLSPSTAQYNNNKVKTPLPKIISTDGKNNILSIKKYFSDENTLKYISTELNFPYDKLINGEHVLLIEPLVYLTFGGKKMVMTATEVAKYDVLKQQKLAKAMGSLTHSNLPTSMYLETSTLGFAPPSKPIPKRLSNGLIMQNYGLGAVHFQSLSPGDGSGAIPNPTEYTYRTGTEVITSVLVKTLKDQQFTPANMGEVTFNILGKKYTKKFICPPNNEELVYVRCTTPNTPQNVQITITSSANLSANNITAKVIDLAENTPPDPQVTDTNKTFKVINPPNHKGINSLSWTQWRAYWQEKWEWIETSPGKGEYIDLGFWEFTKHHYNAKINLKANLKPSDSVKTAIKKGNNYKMKSGYGVQMEINAQKFYTSQDYDVTNAGNAMTFFPEFKFKTYNRVLEKDRKGLFIYKKNKYSFAGENSHYTPIWYPDNAKYEVQAIAFDMWTPAGMLYDYTTDDITINGNVYDDIDISVDLIDPSKKGNQKSSP